MKKLLTFVLTLVLLVTFQLPVMAEEETTLPIDPALLKNGLWYQDIHNPQYVTDEDTGITYQVSYMKIYSIGGTQRVMELSTYPRAYMDTGPHVYTVDTPFEVLQDDLNYYYYYDPEQPELPYREGVNDGDFVYLDTHQVIYLLGETAIHYAGEPLPGAFPLWIESETLPTPSWVDSKNTILPMVYHAIKGQLVTTTLLAAEYKQQNDPRWTVLPDSLFLLMKAYFTDATNDIKITKIAKNKDRTIIRVLYNKVFN